MPTLYAIRGWNKHYENNRTRELKAMTWVPIPIKFDGDGYTELIGHANGAGHYGVWIAVVAVAGRCDPRGTLLRDCARPHDAGTLSRITRMPETLIAEALDRLVSIGWIERKALQDNDPALACGVTAGTCGESAAAPHPTDYGREGNGREGMEGMEGKPPQSLSSPARKRNRPATAEEMLAEAWPDGVPTGDTR